MKKIILLLSIIVLAFAAPAQITYIGILNHNTGTGVNNLFNNYVALGQQCFVDWEVYADGMTGAEACGLRSDSRIVLRRMDNNDSTSVVASTPIIVPGICGGKNGNNDKYYADLGPYLTKAGRYSLEIQADLPNQTNPFGNATTKTTFNYACPSAYYLTGTGGPTGNYYVPSGNCSGGPGLSDPVGGPSADMLTEIFTTLKFFTVGEVGTYRQMIIFDGNFYDLNDGKFQPGNPSVPATLDGKGAIPAYGICPLIAAPQLSIGAEINNFKRTDCGNADVTGAAVFYRIYKDGATPSSFSSFALAFKDDCASGGNGPEGNNFPLGGSCQNGNNILDQRWQTIAGNNNMLPASFALSDTGFWKIDFYLETYMKDCSANNITYQSDINSTGFTVNNPFAPGSACSSVVPVVLSAFTATPNGSNNQLAWSVEEASQVTRFEVQQSFDGFTFSNIGWVQYNNRQAAFNFTDIAYPGRTVFYRIIVYEQSGKKYYSAIARISAKPGVIKISVDPSAQNIMLVLDQFNKGNYQATVVNTAGSLVAQKKLSIRSGGNNNINLSLHNNLAHGIYYAVVKNEQGSIIAKRSFYY